MTMRVSRSWISVKALLLIALATAGSLSAQPKKADDGYDSDVPVTYGDGPVPVISQLRDSPLLAPGQKAKNMTMEKLRARFQEAMDEKLGMMKGTVPDLSDAFSTCYSRQGDFRRTLASMLKKGKNTMQQPRWDFVWTLQTLLVEAGANAKAVMKQRQDMGSKNIVDVVVIGAGVHSAIFNGVATSMRPDLRILTIEAGDVIAKNFMGSGPMFRINSPELMEASANIIAEAPVQLRDLTEDILPVSQVLGEVIVYAQYNSHSNFIFNSPVQNIVQVGDMYKVKTNDGLEVQAPVVILGTGIGTPNIKGLDPMSWGLIYSESNTEFDPMKEVPGIQFFQDATRRIRTAYRANVEPLAPYLGKKVAVIGDGHSGNVFTEFLIGKGFTEIYTKDGDVQADLDLYWVGQKALSFQDFRKRNPHRGAPRYYESLKGIYEPGSRVTPVPGRLSYIKLAEGQAQKYEIGAEGQPPTYADKIVIATGFRSIAVDISKDVGDNARMDWITGTVPGLPANARMVGQILTGPEDAPVKHPLYALGPAAAPLTNDAELDQTITRNRDSINATGPRTEAFSRQLVPGLKHIPEKDQE